MIRPRLTGALTAPLTRRHCVGFLVLITVLFLAAGVIEAARDGPTVDEPTYVAASLAGIKTGNVGINDEHPPLFKVLAALPVLTLHVGLPTPTPIESIYVTEFDENLIARHDLRRAYFLARLVPLIICVLTAAVLFMLGSALWGDAGGLLAALLWLLDPITLGLGHLDGIDVPFAFGVALWAWATHGFWQRPERWRGSALLGVALGVCALGDIDGVVLVVAGLLTVGWRLWRQPIRAVLGAALMLLAALVTIWIPYKVLGGSAVHLGLLPLEFVNGLDYLRANSEAPAFMYLLGMTWTGGRWWFYPLSFVVKLPPGSLLLLVGGLLGAASQLRRRPELIPVLVFPFVTFVVVDSRVVEDFGVRYATPLLMLACLAAGSLIPVLAGLGRAARRWGLGLGGAALASSLIFTALLARSTSRDADQRLHLASGEPVVCHGQAAGCPCAPGQRLGRGLGVEPLGDANSVLAAPVLPGPGDRLDPADLPLCRASVRRARSDRAGRTLYGQPLQPLALSRGVPSRR